MKKTSDQSLVISKINNGIENISSTSLIKNSVSLKNSKKSLTGSFSSSWSQDHLVVNVSSRKIQQILMRDLIWLSQSRVVISQSSRKSLNFDHSKSSDSTRYTSKKRWISRSSSKKRRKREMLSSDREVSDSRDGSWCYHHWIEMNSRRLLQLSRKRRWVIWWVSCSPESIRDSSVDICLVVVMRLFLLVDMLEEFILRFLCFFSESFSECLIWLCL